MVKVHAKGLKNAVKRFWQISLGLMALVAITLLTLFLARIPIAEHFLTSTLERRGLENVELEITRLDTAGINMGPFNAGQDVQAPDFVVESVVIQWSIGDLLDGKVDDILISGVNATILRTGDGYSVGGMPLSTGNSRNDSGAPGLSVDRLALSDIELTYQSEDDAVSANVFGQYSRKDGGQLEVRARTDGIRIGDRDVENASFDANLSLAPDYSFNGAASLQADLIFAGKSYRGLTGNASFSGDDLLTLAADWKATQASLTFDMEAPAIPLTGLEQYDGVIEFFAGSVPESVALTGRGLIRLTEGTISFENTLTDYMTASTNTGQTFYLSAPAGTLLGEWSDTSEYLNIAYFVEGLKASPATGDIMIRRDEGAPYQIQSSFTASEWNDDSFTLVPGSISFTGTLDSTLINGDIVITGGATRLNTNNMSLQNILASGDFSLNADLENQRAVITVPRGCVSLAAPSATTRNGRFSFRNARFCPPAYGPIVLVATMNEAGEFSIKGDGILAADNMSAIIGSTSVMGNPPTASVSMEIINREATANTSLTGGNISVNQRVGFANIRGTGQARYKEGDIKVEGSVASLTLRDLKQNNAFSPLIFTGDFSVADATAAFTGNLALPGADSFSTLRGNYDLGLRDGTAIVDFGPLTLNADGFQIVDVIPPLSGIVENAAGTIGGNLQMRLARDGLQTTANLSVDKLTFNGPTRAVTQTSDLSLNADFDGLAPLKTRGEQQATIDLIDLDALKLENGDVRFDAPGDGTMRINQAIWPWFGGTLAIENGIIPLDGSQISVPLQVQDIDLRELLEFVGVEGLTGEGRLEGELPVIIENGEARIVDGQLRASTPGRIAYDSIALQKAAENSGSAGQLAFDALSNFEFTALALDINGALAGDVTIGLRMEGNSTEVVDNAGINYNININAPLSGLLRQLSEQQRRKEGFASDVAGELGLELEFGDVQRVEPEGE